MRHNWKAVHVRTLAELPENLKLGRAYFVDDEGVILVNHGDNRGIQVYGNRPGPQGIPGEPLPQIDSNIDSLARAAVFNTKTLYNEIKRRRESISQEAETREKEVSQARAESQEAVYNEKTARTLGETELQRQIDSLAGASLFQTKAIYYETQRRKYLDDLHKLLTQRVEIQENALNQEISKRVNDTQASKSYDENLQNQVDSLARASVKNTLALYHETLQRRNSELKADNQISNLQDQIDTLAKTSIKHAQVILNEYKQRRLESLTRANADSELQRQTDTLAKAVISLTGIIARQSKLIAHIWEESGIKAKDMQDSGWIELISDVFNDSDTHDDSEGSLQESEKEAINEIISEIFG